MPAIALKCGGWRKWGERFGAERPEGGPGTRRNERGAARAPEGTLCRHRGDGTLTGHFTLPKAA